MDPWLDGNHKAATNTSDVKEANIVCVIHDYMDYVGSAFEICKQTGEMFVGTPELCSYAEENQVVEVVGFNIGGTANVKGVHITMIKAFHMATEVFLQVLS